jgi:hypothetical protein
MTCYLYRHFGHGNELLYVGISLSAIARLSQHRSSPWFKEIVRVEIECHPTREYAQFQEHWAVKHEKPKYNKIAPSYDSSSPTLIKLCIRYARDEIWMDSWDPGKDHSSHEEVLLLCHELENWDVSSSRKAEGTLP